MTQQDFDDETLMAFADGELDEARSGALEAALAEDEALAERLAVFLESRRLVGDALKPLIDEPVPEQLLQSVRAMADAARSARADAGNVVPLRRHPRRETRQWLMPLAASIIAVVTGVAGFVAGRSLGPPATDAGLEIAAVLDREASGHDVTLGSSGEVLRIVSTFRDGKGALCREYEVDQSERSTLSVACRQDRAWLPRLAIISAKTEGYAPASSQETIDIYLSSIQAGAPLSADEEQSALASAGK